jgi:hypothetical protein
MTTPAPPDDGREPAPVLLRPELDESREAFTQRFLEALDLPVEPPDAET